MKSINGPKQTMENQLPKWNFYKILINKEGKIEDTYASLTSPTSKKIIKKLKVC